ncbi:MAG: hypothetical protein WDA21_01775 [Bacilli bacterium]
MKLENIKRLHEEIGMELEVMTAQYYALGQFIKVFKEAEKKYSKLLSDIKYYRKRVAGLKTYPTLKPDAQKRLNELNKIKNSGVISVNLEEEIEVSSWSSSGDAGYFASSIRQDNHNWEDELETTKERHKVLQALCYTKNIDYNMKAEKRESAGFGSTSMVLCSTFQVPIIRHKIENVQELDNRQVAGDLKAAAYVYQVRNK